eukprot:358906-Chlamydomonas_euryale.AAC.1
MSMGGMPCARVCGKRMCGAQLGVQATGTRYEHGRHAVCGSVREMDVWGAGGHTGHWRPPYRLLVGVGVCGAWEVWRCVQIP